LKQFDHIGIHTDEPQEGEIWVDHSEIWITNPRRHPQRIEYLRPKVRPVVDPQNVGLWKLWNWPHIAFRVDDLESAIGEDEVVYGPVDSAEARVAFVHKDGGIVEYLEYLRLDTWHGEPTPWSETISGKRGA